jgi:diaminopimelate epimerase
MGASTRQFFKMSGSGNDFVFFDVRSAPAGELMREEQIRSLCARGTGVGADGVVYLEPSALADVRIRYFNSDGSLASLCGNAALCATQLSADLGAIDPSAATLETDAGVLQVRLTDDVPEIDLEPVIDVRPDAVATFAIGPAAGERRIGFALAGVPHLVVLVDDVDRVDVTGRGRELRWHARLERGANVNFVAAAADRWRIRTFERGVEGETLACGTGAVAAAVLLNAWGQTGATTALETRSGRRLGVRLAQEPIGVRPSLSGEGRLVFRGELAELWDADRGAAAAGGLAPKALGARS